MGSGSTAAGPAGIVLPGLIRAVGRFTGLVQFALPVCAVRGGFGFRHIVLAFRSGLALRRRVIAFGHVALCLHASVSLGTQHGQLLIQGAQLAEHVAQRLGHGLALLPQVQRPDGNLAEQLAPPRFQIDFIQLLMALVAMLLAPLPNASKPLKNAIFTLLPKAAML